MRPPVAGREPVRVTRSSATTCDFINSYADLRPDRATEIMAQMDGGSPSSGANPFLHPARTPYTLELLAAALRTANVARCGSSRRWRAAALTNTRLRSSR